MSELNFLECVGLVTLVYVCVGLFRVCMLIATADSDQFWDLKKFELLFWGVPALLICAVIFGCLWLCGIPIAGDESKD